MNSLLRKRRRDFNKRVASRVVDERDREAIMNYWGSKGIRVY